MRRLSDVMRLVGMAGLLAAIAFRFAPTGTDVAALDLPQSSALPAVVPGARAAADSLAEDIILHNLFSASRTFPTRRYSATGAAMPGGDMGTTDPAQAGGDVPAGSGFTPALVGTAVSDRPEETRALLQLDPADPTPRLYSVGDRAGGYRVVSIEPRAVVLAGPRGRVVLRLPEEDLS